MDDLETWQLLRPFTMVKKLRFATNLELARSVQNVPGDVIEAGTWRGGMAAGIAATLGNGRHYWLFDSFEGLPPADLKRDGRKAVALTGKCRAGEHYAARAMESVGADNYTLARGWFADTLPTATFDNGIALLRLDCDWYESTMQCLEYLYPQLNPGGICIIDDYFYWPGCRQAVIDYLARSAMSDAIEQTGSDPVAFIRKGRY